MADLLIGFLQTIGLHTLAYQTRPAGQPLMHEAAVQQPLRKPMIEGNSEKHASHCRMDEEFRNLVNQSEVGI